MKKLTEALGISITTGRANIYLESMADLNDEELSWAIEAAIREWGSAPNHMMGALPPIGFIRERASRYWEAKQKRIAETNTARLLARGEKPDDWDCGPSERQRYARAYVNAGHDVRGVMKSMGSLDAIRYAEACGVDMRTIKTGPGASLASMVADAIPDGGSLAANDGGHDAV